MTYRNGAYFKALTKNRRVLIVGHADADGHLAAEQSRRNASRGGASRCDVFVDVKRTASYRIWRNHLWEIPIRSADTVVFVDLMFHPDDVVGSVNMLTELASENPKKQFVVIDHHPYSGLPALPVNLGIWFTSAVYTCCFGSPSDLMVVASICDRDEEPVVAMIDETMRRRALGMERAAADRNLAGTKLLGLLKNDRWDLIEQLAVEPKDIHQRARGRRHSRQPLSPGLERARGAADY